MVLLFSPWCLTPYSFFFFNIHSHIVLSLNLIKFNIKYAYYTNHLSFTAHSFKTGPYLAVLTHSGPRSVFITPSSHSVLRLNKHNSRGMQVSGIKITTLTYSWLCAWWRRRRWRLWGRTVTGWTCRRSGSSSSRRSSPPRGSDDRTALHKERSRENLL